MTGTPGPVVDRGPANHRRQGYGGPPKRHAKAEAGHSRRPALVLFVLVVVAAAACNRLGEPKRAPIVAAALRGSNVLLITIDTLRADHVGAYGSAKGLTPTIDEFAASGIRFERTYAHVPLTLPSHASLLTASYPTTNDVHDNGAFRLGESTGTVAEALKRAGYRTAAFVGAFVLDARFGLARGFDLYDDRMLGRGGDVEFVQRSAEQVLAPARQWILQPPRPRSGGDPLPWFVWVHLYDPHEPYAPPEPYRTRYASAPYDGEIAYADAALGSFVAELRRGNALTNTLVVIASDHGESLGEHGERTHGLFAYDATLRVPLVMWSPPALRPSIVADTMRLVDVAPTVLDLLGAPAMTNVDGRSVRTFVGGERPFDRAASYFEALNANLARGWAPLTGVVVDRLKLIDLPIPELYDLDADPGEQHNLYAQQRGRARDLEGRLDQIARHASPIVPSAPIGADAEARLRSLGYVVSSAPRPAKTYGSADDPKTLVHLNMALDDASTAWGRGDAETAVHTLQGIVRERPDFITAYDRLGAILRTIGQVDEAVRVLDAAARGGHADRNILRSLGAALRDAGNLERSAAVLGELAGGDEADLQTADEFGVTLTRLGRRAEAERQFRRVLAVSPNAAETWNNLGSLFLTGRRYADAAAALSRATEIDPSLASAHNGLGVVYAAQGHMDRAVAEWTRALELRPGYPDAQYNLDRARK
jgi:arylsulfatase A-like enzyme/Flp pilus assembly protein TadD